MVVVANCVSTVCVPSADFARRIIANGSCKANNVMSKTEATFLGNMSFSLPMDVVIEVARIAEHSVIKLYQITLVSQYT